MRSFEISTQQILDLRPDAERPKPGDSPIAALIEQEPSCPTGDPLDVLTVLLRGSECRFRCLMCDLWKSTHLGETPAGAIPRQIKEAITSLAADKQQPRWLKLYNASNFFANYNVPKVDFPEIAKLCSPFERVIVENHPKVSNASINQFRDEISGQLEIAMGLETIHPDVLKSLNKGMTLNDFSRACDELLQSSIDVRAFVLLRPPGMCEAEGIEWCLKSIEFAVSCGVRHISVIPLRAGNGAIEHLASQGLFETPHVESLEVILRDSITALVATITVDIWDWPKLRGHCPKCESSRRSRLESANLHQEWEALPNGITCDCTMLA